MNFNGNWSLNQFINLTHQSQYTSMNTTNFSASFWLKISNNSQTQQLIAKGGTTWGNKGFQIYVHATYHSINLDLGDGNLWTGQTCSGGVISENTWTYVTVVYKINSSTNGTYECYLNGILNHTQPTKFYTFLDSGSPLYIGTQGGSSNMLNGSLDEILIFGRALNSSEVLALYNSSANQYYNNFTNQADGIHNFTAYSSDAYGFLSQTSLVTITTDTITPILTLTTPSNNQIFLREGINNKNISIKYSISDTYLNHSNYSIIYPNGSVMQSNTSAGSNQNIVLSTFALGNYQLNIFANDSAGNNLSNSTLFILDLSQGGIFRSLETNKTINQTSNQTAVIGDQAEDEWLGLKIFIFAFMIFGVITILMGGSKKPRRIIVERR